MLDSMQGTMAEAGAKIVVADTPGTLGIIALAETTDAVSSDVSRVAAAVVEALTAGLLPWNDEVPLYSGPQHYLVQYHQNY